jgi:hypothetical protein
VCGVWRVVCGEMCGVCAGVRGVCTRVLPFPPLHQDGDGGGDSAEAAAAGDVVDPNNLLRILVATDLHVGYKEKHEVRRGRSRPGTHLSGARVVCVVCVWLWAGWGGGGRCVEPLFGGLALGVGWRGRGP